MKKLIIVLFSILLLSGCKNATDIKYNEIYEKLFQLKLGYDVVLSMLDNILERQIDFKNGMKYIDKNNKNLTIEELRLLNQGEYFLHFTPAIKEIEDANIVISKINKVKPLMQNITNLCNQTIILYKAGKDYDRIDKIIKHPESDYAKMEENFQEIKRINKELTTILEMSVIEFLKPYDVNNSIDTIISGWLKSLD